jgi:hypothetical protein
MLKELLVDAISSHRHGGKHYTRQCWNIKEFLSGRQFSSAGAFIPQVKILSKARDLFFKLQGCWSSKSH